jgi:hypothetical protein
MNVEASEAIVRGLKGAGIVLGKFHPVSIPKRLNTSVGKFNPP